MKRLVSALMGTLLLAGSLSALPALPVNAATPLPRVLKAAFPLPVDSCKLYLTQTQAPDPEVIPTLLAGARVTYQPSRKDWKKAEIRYGTQIVKLERVADYWHVRDEKVSLNNLLTRLNALKNPTTGYELDQKRAYLQQVLYITSSDPDDPDWPQLLSAMSQVWRGTLRYRDEMLDPRLRVLLAPNNDIDPNSEVAYFPSSLARRTRSEQLLMQRKIPIYKNYPPLLAEEELVLRKPKEVLKRALVLLVLGSTTTTLTQTEGYELLKKWGISHELTAKEWDYLRDTDLNETELGLMNWQFESAYSLLWALGIAQKATFPTETSDLKNLIQRIESRSFEQWYVQAKLRKPSEILDQLDMYQRVLWARAEQNKREWPDLGIKPYVALHWTISLLWLTSNDSWDSLMAIRGTPDAAPEKSETPIKQPETADPVEELERELNEG